ncbi:hypothetical protein D3C75_956540 [compost metagenome]
MSKVLLDKNYSADELNDLERDMYEAIDGAYNPEVAEIPDDEAGTFRVQITWTPDE